MTNTTTAGVSGTVSAALVVILCTLFPTYDVVFWGSVVGVVYAVPAFLVRAVRYVNMLRKVAHETDEAAASHAVALAEAAEARRRVATRQNEATQNPS